ncbi:MAG: MOSC domain-containing protein [Hyphomicrobium sp.]
MNITHLFRYPVKGLSAEPLTNVAVREGETLPFDRAYAIENGPGAFDPAAPRHLPKVAFVMLMRHEALAGLETAFDTKTRVLTIRQGGRVVASGNLDCEAGRAGIEAFIAELVAGGLRGAPRVVASPPHSFSDVAARCVHIVNQRSVQALETSLGLPIDRRRFRPNIVIDGVDAWSELDWVGRNLVSEGGARLEVFKRTERCAATNVDPETGIRDLKIPSYLSRTLGHTDFGVYARVKSGGALAIGDRLTLATP